MELSDWLPSAVALVVGIGSVLLSNFYIDNREKKKARDQRTKAMSDYAHALLEWHLFNFSRLGVGSGSHPMPSAERLEEAARKFYPYLSEFKGHVHYGNLMSPYPESELMTEPWDESDFYQNACDAIENHLAKYPKKPAKDAYLKEAK